MTCLPNSENAYIDAAKIRDYILSTAHPIGRFKAAFFFKLGYSQDRWEQLELDIRQQHLPLDAEQIAQSEYGTKYAIKGFLKSPNGGKVLLQSIWIILEGDNIPRFVTIYPE